MTVVILNRWKKFPRRALVIALLTNACIASCDRRRETKSTQNLSATRSSMKTIAAKTIAPKTIAPKPIAPNLNIASTGPTLPTLIASTSPVATPRDSVMSIDGDRLAFPGAKLRVAVDDGKVIALLHSDDPRDAINEDYHGNSFYFQMELDAADPAQFAASSWRFVAASASQDDSPYGIFLDGHRQQLQPLDVKVTFDAISPAETTVWIVGKFLRVDVQDMNEPPRVISLAARLDAQTIVKTGE